MFLGKHGQFFDIENIALGLFQALEAPIWLAVAIAAWPAWPRHSGLGVRESS
jgi:hypothetical protein